MGKRKAGKFKKKESSPSKKRPIHADVDDDMMNDDIDSFHKQRDVVPLDVEQDAVDSDDEDNDHPVFNLESGGADEESDDGVDYDEDDEDIDDTGLAAKIVRQARYLRAKTGGVDDEMHEDIEDEDKTSLWGRSKSMYYQRDDLGNELQSSDDEGLAEEEAEVLRLQKEKAKFLSAEDFGVEDVNQDKIGGEPTLKEISMRTKKLLDVSPSKQDDKGIAYEEVKKDPDALTREEQMDVVYSSAPELVGLLPELNVAFDELENEVNPLLGKIKEADGASKGAIQYLEVKQLLLLSYCQAITFYLLLKSDGQPVRDHPVIARLVEIKMLLDKIKALDMNLPVGLMDILKNRTSDERTERLLEGKSMKPVHLNEGHESPLIPVNRTEMSQVLEASASLDNDSLRTYKNTGEKFQHQEPEVSVLSKEMLRVRAALEEKLRQKGIFHSIEKKQDGLKKCQHVNGKLEMLEDFDDETMDIEKSKKDKRDGVPTVRNTLAPFANKAKLAPGGDDDIPKRDDIGERRRKRELRVLAGAGITSVDDKSDEAEAFESDDVANSLDDASDSDIEFYKQVEQKHATKLAAKAEIHSRPAKTPSEPEALVNGKRQISYQIEKNRGLTRPRKKQNPRTSYKKKHDKAKKRRTGQVRSMRKESGPYGGEASGINTGISRSIRF